MDINLNDTNDASETSEHQIDIDSFYNTNDEELVQSILNQIGFGITAHYFKGAFIDYESLINMNTSHILSVLKDFPIGYAIKFEIALNKWKSLQHNINSQSFISVTHDSNLQISEGIILRILQKTSEGIDFLNNIDKSRPMSKNERSKLVKLILTPFFKNKQLLSTKQITDLAKEIQNEFPKELISSYVNLKKGGGKLYNKYNYTLKVLRGEKQMPESSLTNKRNSNKKL